ncbi:hypothetical protein [Streptomyces sp. NBC_00344]|uniref:hypothetical protein n=1 Tax=Streptomyces sp. NBC_00344 TaxID=2975720 RepID=UPI002E251DC8
MPSPPSLLSATGLHTTYGPTPELAGADFAISSGETYSDREIVVRDGRSRDLEHIG